MSTEKTTQTMDEVMLAMDIVDTIRRDKRIVEQELSSELREDQLLSRLKTIYGTQGIEVSDQVLKEGIRSLREDRFTYTPSSRSIFRSLALLYVRRKAWLRPVLLFTLLFITMILAYIVFLSPDQMMAYPLGNPPITGEP
ncbi:MAG: DUF6384 family protein [Alphaproteobacteria bacterium]